MITPGHRIARTLDLAVVRHGRTAWNADGRFQGQTDVPLDDIGRAQARALGLAMKHDVFDRAIASDLSRASETARIVLGERSVALEFDARLREMRFGVWEGLTWAQIVQRDPRLAQGNATSPRFFTPDGGESFDEVCARVAGALDAIAANAPDDARVLIVTHAGILHALLRVALGESEATALGVRFSPATVTRLRVGPTGGTLVQLNYAPPDTTVSA
ncbi:MAG: histidine phosphatase family protein [Vulcanimicrobiaceae bacterium]